MGRRVKISKKTKQRLAQAYYSPQYPGSLGGIKALKQRVKLSPTKIKDWIRGQDAYTLHHPVRYKFPRRKIIVSGKDALWMTDLIDVQRIKRENDSFKFLLTIIDVFSKFAFVVPIRDKTGDSIIQAFDTVLSQGRKPKKLCSDKGTEFKNQAFQKYLKQKNIEFYTTENEDIKASIVERFNRTLKEKMWRYFTKKNSQRYVEVLPLLVRAYNQSYHRSIKRSPASVDHTNQEEVWQALYGQQQTYPKQPPLKVGDTVRISKSRRQFKKGYLPSWTEELFTVSRVLQTKPITFKIKDDHGEELKGSFYAQELQKVAEKQVFRIESILKHKAGKPNLYLVKWYGYNDSFNSWIPQSALTKYAS